MPASGRWRFFKFFQAEDGIRDVERSRGLGDVYKRQVMTHASMNKSHDRPNTIVSHVDVNILFLASDTGYLTCFSPKMIKDVFVLF